MFNAFKKLGRKSESQSTNNELSRIASITSTTSNRSKKIARTKSLSKRLSIFSTNSNESDDLNSIASESPEESHQLARFKSLNFDKFNKQVLTYLKIQGLSAPKILTDQPHIRISMSSSGDDVFLPSLVAFSEEEQQDLDINSPININAAINSNLASHSQNTDDGASRPTETILQDESHLNAPSNDDSADPVSHTFAIIVSLYRPSSISTITTQLQTNVRTLWPKGLPSDRSIKNETFEIGQTNWDLNIGNYNYFVPFGENAIDDDSYSSFEQIELDELDANKYLTEQRIPPKTHQLKTYDQVIRGGYSNFKKHTDDPFIIGSLQKSSGSVLYPPGDYIFLLPIQFSPKIPESLVTEKSQVYYNLKTIVVPKGNKIYDYGENVINFLRGPPVTGITTADKPIFVNKVWNDALNYEISFPKKYVTIGSELPIKLKFAPLSKDVSIKRIKINVLEKITYVSKDLKYEYDEEVSADDSLIRNNERVIPLLEIRTKSRVSTAIRQEIVETNHDNLLSCLGASPEDDNIIGMLNVSAFVPFVKPQKPLKFYEHVNNSVRNPLIPTITNPGKFTNKQVSEELKTKIINQNIKVLPQTKIHYEFLEGLYPDSLNNRYVHIDHKLQVSLRISRKDTAKSQIHHYEVMIDTPLFLLNSLCVADSVELPSYDQTIPRHITTTFQNMDIEEDADERDHLPTFEEATSPMSSPTLGPANPGFPVVGEETINVLSRTSTLAGPGGYDHIDHLIENDKLSLEEFHRRGSTARSEILNSFRRTISHVNDDAVDDDEDSSGYESEVHNSKPPNYEEVLSLLSDDGSDDPAYSVNGFSGEANESVDMTELIR